MWRVRKLGRFLVTVFLLAVLQAFLYVVLTYRVWWLVVQGSAWQRV